MEYIAHHGIKGQKWGIRRYQNPDGTLTDAGKKRFGYGLKKGTVKYERKHNKAYKELRSDLDREQSKYLKVERKFIKDIYKKNPPGVYSNKPDPKIEALHKKAYDNFISREKAMNKTLKELRMDKKEIAYRKAGYDYVKYLQGDAASVAVSYAIAGPIGMAAYRAYRPYTRKGKALGTVYAKAAERYKG